MKKKGISGIWMHVKDKIWENKDSKNMTGYPISVVFTTA